MSSINRTSTIEQTFELLVRCMMQSKHHLIEVGAGHNLTAMQTIMLSLLNEPKPMNSFTKVFACDASNVTGLVDGLEAKGLAARFPDEQDRRIKMVKLNSKGQALRKKILENIASSNKIYFKDLSDKELEQLQETLVKMVT
ncbi:MAG TPA: MarR family transcriptional regulator [Candidatus Sulfotelmatobacter sp.]|nr:MarR family transcriptional regulator [Candidatus Sulfotelmatobacter sp.]